MYALVFQSESVALMTRGKILCADKERESAKSRRTDWKWVEGGGDMGKWTMKGAAKLG